MTMDKLECNVVDWALKRNLYRESTEKTRLAKMREEAQELIDAIDSGVEMDIMMEFGDVMVTGINYFYPKGYWLDHPLGMAYAKIKDRKGKMVNGTFVRDREAE
jgi:hypothetical protein